MRQLLSAGIFAILFALEFQCAVVAQEPESSRVSTDSLEQAVDAVHEASIADPKAGGSRIVATAEMEHHDGRTGCPHTAAVPEDIINPEDIGRACRPATAAEMEHGDNCTLHIAHCTLNDPSALRLPPSALPQSSPSSSIFSSLLPKIRTASGIIFITLMVVMLAFAEFDHLHPKTLHNELPVSIVIPCYNDGDSVCETISSVFKAYPASLVDLTVVNDCSSDDSLVKIRALLTKYSFRIINNSTNKGKARSLNDAIASVRHDLVLCLDADTILNKPAIHDMLARFEHDQSLGAVSCPYRPRNRGFLPSMQAVEYSMLLLTQGAHNIFSAMALWGGCLMVRKQAFDACGGFNLSAITEDVDLAFQLNRHSWRVEQSFRPVRSMVPDTIPGWIRQKLRWTAGGLQCYLRHFRVWIRNPIQIFFIFSYSLFVISSIPQFFDSVDLGEDVIELWNESHTVWQNLVKINAIFGRDIFTRLGRLALCLLTTSVYVFPLISRPRDIFKLLLVIPFSLLYFPVYIVLSFFGMARGIRSVLFPKKSDTCGWKTT